MTSPFGAVANRSARSARRPRSTCSCSFESSRHTAASRSGSAAASAASVAGSRRGDSNATTGSPHASSRRTSAAARAAGLGRKPANTNPAPPRPEAATAAVTAEGPGQHRDLEARRGDGRHDAGAGIGDGGHPGVGGERHPLAATDALHDLAGARTASLCSCTASSGYRDAVAVEQDARAAGVLAGHHVGAAQLVEQPQRDVGEVSDRRRADDQGAGSAGGFGHCEVPLKRRGRLQADQAVPHLSRRQSRARRPRLRPLRLRRRRLGDGRSAPPAHARGAAAAGLPRPRRAAGPPGGRARRRSRRAAFLRRRWKRILAIGIPVCFLLFVRLALPRVPQLLERDREREQAPEQGHLAALQPAGNILTSPQISLIMGSDSRGANAITGARSDSILLVRTDPSNHLISMLSIPRDLDVPIPGHGTNKINASFAFGGPPLLIRTVDGFTGLGVNHMVLVDFTGFKDLIDSLGGVTIYNPYKVVSSQPFDGLIWHFAKGTIHLDGRHALAYARIRHTTNPRDSDITRTERQQRVTQALMRQAGHPVVPLPPAADRARHRQAARDRSVGERADRDGLDQVPGVAHARVPPGRPAGLDRRPGRAPAERAEHGRCADVPREPGAAAGSGDAAVRTRLHRPLSWCAKRGLTPFGGPIRQPAITRVEIATIASPRAMAAGAQLSPRRPSWSRCPWRSRPTAWSRTTWPSRTTWNRRPSIGVARRRLGRPSAATFLPRP